MFNTIANHLVAQAGKNGWNVMATHGGVGAGLGAVYGAISDNETIMGGAFRGGIVGGGAGFGAKYFGSKYVQGMNNMAAHMSGINPGVNKSTDWRGTFLTKSTPGSGDFDDSTKKRILFGQASSLFGGYNNKAFSWAGELEDDWFTSSKSLNKGLIDGLAETGSSFNKAKQDFLSDTTKKAEDKDLLRSVLGVGYQNDHSNSPVFKDILTNNISNYNKSFNSLVNNPNKT